MFLNKECCAADMSIATKVSVGLFISCIVFEGQWT